ncbi:hypothetical protein PkoCFBP13504_05725 [Pseudomonas koreensis]|nr:hypothetical protein PkoCFBP13504_05725 [Pseudomonas koreensis]
MHDSGRCLKEGLTRLPTRRASDISDLLPHRWMPISLCNPISTICPRPARSVSAIHVQKVVDQF